jgi:hypothetical protein
MYESTMRSHPMKTFAYAFRTHGKETWDSKEILSPDFLKCDKTYCSCSFENGKLMFRCNNFCKLSNCTYLPYVFSHFAFLEYMFMLWRKQNELNDEFFSPNIHYEDLSECTIVQCTPVILKEYHAYAINQDIKFLLELATSIDMLKGPGEVVNTNLRTILKSLAMMSLVDLSLKNNSYLKTSKNEFSATIKDVIVKQLCELPEREIVQKVCSYIELDLFTLLKEWNRVL